jgi:galactokinase
VRTVEARAPGRVNLIGEHTDYNDGFVLPCAIASGTRVLATERSARIVTARSKAGEPARFNLDRLPAERGNVWSDYLRGMLIELHAAHIALRGADLRIQGDVPIGAGLASSASFEIAVALAMLAIVNAELPAQRLAQLAQRAETLHVGTRCGIMDQLAVLCAQPGHALFLDTRTLEMEQIPVPRGVAIVVCNTMVKHELASGAYNERHAQCERAVALLQTRYPHVRALRDVSAEQLRHAQTLLPPPLLQRARHVVTENARVMEAVRALREGDAARLGALMYASHQSLRDDYEVSCKELDILVELAREFEGTLGARMTGGGFGGCTVNLVRADRAEAFRTHVCAGYQSRTGIAAELYDGSPSAGASVHRD